LRWLLTFFQSKGVPLSPRAQVWLNDDRVEAELRFVAGSEKGFAGMSARYDQCHGAVIAGIVSGQALTKF